MNSTIARIAASALTLLAGELPMMVQGQEVLQISHQQWCKSHYYDLPVQSPNGEMVAYCSLMEDGDRSKPRSICVMPTAPNARRIAVFQQLTSTSTLASSRTGWITTG